MPRDFHTMPLSSQDRRIRNFLYNAYGALEPRAEASETVPREAQTSMPGLLDCSGGRG